MTKLIIIAAAVIALLCAGAGIVIKIRADAAEQERLKIHNAQIAEANQKIAERRVTDAKFNKMDAAAFCRGAGLEWVSIDGKSYCQ